MALLVNMVDHAVASAALGRVAAGYRERDYSLDRAREAWDDGVPLAPGLVARYRLALDDLCKLHGLRMG